MSSKPIKRKRFGKSKSKYQKNDCYETISHSSATIKKRKAKTIPSAENIRKRQLLEANAEEDREIRRLEKLLKIKKGGKLPSVFIEDGLADILEVVDRIEGKGVLSDDSDDLEEDLKAIKGKPSQSSLKHSYSKPRTLSELMKEKKGIANEKEIICEENISGENDDESCSDDLECENSDVDEDFNESCEEENDLPKPEKKPTKNNKPDKTPKIWEDIYGRLRDESGNIIKSTSEDKNQKYIPPKLRKQSVDDDESKNENYTRIKRNLKGLLNRLSESNLQTICNQIEEMYMKYSRNDMNEALFLLISELLFTPIPSPPRLLIEQAMLVALLHANIGSEVGAYFLQHIIEKLGSLFENKGSYGEGKECNNLLTFLSHLYNFKVTHSTLVFDIFHILVESFDNKDIELIQLFLRSIGFVLRKDNPLKLKELVLAIQAKAASFKRDNDDSRVKFMLETLTAIRNNNMYKIPDYDPSIVEHSKKVLRGLIRKGCSIQELAISYEDLLKADERGRWWIVGSAWAQSEDPAKKQNDSEGAINMPKTEVSEKILELARKQHMNTDVRKAIFCILMSAEDFMDAFEKLLKLNLKNQQEREIIHVLLHCALQEKNFNPYYVYLAEKFCNFARKHQMCLQFALWDKFKELTNMKAYKVNNLSRFLSHLFTSGALPLSVLKVIHFSDMNKTLVRFFRQILLAILLHDSEEMCVQAFKRISQADNLKLLRESLRLFMHHFVLRNQSKLDPEVASKLEERVKLAENALKSPKRIF